MTRSRNRHPANRLGQKRGKRERRSPQPQAHNDLPFMTRLMNEALGFTSRRKK